MTNREALENIKKELLKEEKSFERLKKLNALEKLILSTHPNTGNINNVIVPVYEHDIEFLKKVIQDLGYTAEYKEDWNHFYNTTCCYVRL